MGRSLLLLATAAALGAQELPAPMRRAVESLAKKPLRPVTATTSGAEQLGQPAKQAKTCAVPPLEMQVDHPERYTVKLLPSQPRSGRTRVVEPPAPSCDQTTTAKP